MIQSFKTFQGFGFIFDSLILTIITIRTISQLEQYVIQIQTRLGHLNAITIPQSELSTDFALPRSSEIEAERNRIRVYFDFWQTH